MAGRKARVRALQAPSALDVAVPAPRKRGERTARNNGIFPRDRLFLIAGPCVLEDDELNLRVAEKIAALNDRVPGGVVFKASFDKANRSNPDAARGPGLERGLAALERVKRSSGLRIVTDVHLPEQCAPAAEVADALQIPAFLCRQTDLLAAAGATGRAVNVKKGQWMHPEGMAGAVEKVRAARHGGGGEVAVTERGTFYGYGDLVVDMRSFSRIRQACDAPVIFDATHSVQQPGQGPDGASGGTREFIAPLLSAAIAAGANGIFIETHPDPDHAPSDGPNMLPLGELDRVIDRAIALWETARA
jgi:2-dehydro-3-deoxyphosphooctonate aldolase (KDO 8-P synthase)